MKLRAFLAIAVILVASAATPILPGDESTLPSSRPSTRSSIHLAHGVSGEGHRHAEEPGAQVNELAGKVYAAKLPASSAKSRPSTTPAWPVRASVDATTPPPRAPTTRPCSMPPKSCTPSTRCSSASPAVLKEMDEFHKVLYVVYHTHLPAKDWAAYGPPPDLKAKAEA